jgi:phosphatidate cytidylyltransferase
VLSVCVLRNSLFHGSTALLWLFAVVWGTDIMAYFGGRLIGGPKLWPRVSPGKTWSGFVVGVTCGALAGVWAVVLSTMPGEVALAPLLPLGLAAAAVSQAGDLFESAIKRRFDVKDSSRLIPGHGGVMDRLDGFIFAAIFAALVGALHTGYIAAAHGLLVW